MLLGFSLELRKYGFGRFEELILVFGWEVQLVCSLDSGDAMDGTQKTQLREMKIRDNEIISQENFSEVKRMDFSWENI